MDELAFHVIGPWAVKSAYLLHCLSASSEQQAADRLCSAFIACPTPKKITPFDSMCLFVLYGGDNLLVLSDDEWIVRALVLKIGENLECLVLVFVGDEPPAE
jgi:hypothetical protein